MADEPKMGAWAVALSFESGVIVINTLVAPNASSACALTGIEAGRRNEGAATSIAWAELSAEWLRFALRAIETGKASGDVVSLVSNNDPPAGALGGGLQAGLEPAEAQAAGVVGNVGEINARPWSWPQADGDEEQRLVASQLQPVPTCWRHPQQFVPPGTICPICYAP